MSGHVNGINITDCMYLLRLQDRWNLYILGKGARKRGSEEESVKVRKNWQTRVSASGIKKV